MLFGVVGGFLGCPKWGQPNCTGGTWGEKTSALILRQAALPRDTGFQSATVWWGGRNKPKATLQLQRVVRWVRGGQTGPPPGQGRSSREGDGGIVTGRGWRGQGKAHFSSKSPGCGAPCSLWLRGGPGCPPPRGSEPLSPRDYFLFKSPALAGGAGPGAGPPRPLHKGRRVHLLSLKY